MPRVSVVYPMNERKESKDWNEMFAFDLPARAVSHVSRECCEACLEAKEIKCVCACGGKNHGAALKKDVKSLDEFSSPNPRPLEYIS